MDEPTTSLTEAEIKQIFRIMRTLRDKGVAIIFISHKLGEVMEICDRYTVLRNGKTVDAGLISETNANELSEKLVGHTISEDFGKRKCEYGDIVLQTEHFGDNKHFNDINFVVRKGQILGVTGLLGDGRTEIFETIFGANKKKYNGKIFFKGEEYRPRSTHSSLKNKIAYIPSDRKENGIIKDLSVIDNGTISVLSKLAGLLFVDEDRCEEMFNVQKEQLNIKSDDINLSITTLSGGNQQKVVLEKWLLTEPDLLILDNPTQGVDVGAKAEIYNFIRKEADAGKAVIWLSPEAHEIVSNCDNAYVLYHGNVVGYLEDDSLNEYNIMKLATGGKLNN